MNQQGEGQKMKIDAATMQRLQSRLLSEQNLLLGIVGGFVATLIGAAIWAAVTLATGYQIGWMAVGVGFLVGLAVRLLGKGITPAFGLVGAVGALLGCLLGNLFSVCGFAASQQNVPFSNLLFGLLSEPAALVELCKATFQPMDLLFYGIAVYEGYNFAFRQITAEDIQAMQSGR